MFFSGGSVFFYLDVRAVARKLRDHQGVLTGDRIYQNFHAQVQLAADNEHFDDRASQIIVNTRNAKLYCMLLYKVRFINTM